MKIELGSIARDKITGFEGVVIARTDWLNGCVRYVIQPKLLKDGKPIESVAFNEAQLELIEPEMPAAPVKSRGGPKPDPSRNPDPAR